MFPLFYCDVKVGSSFNWHNSTKTNVKKFFPQSLIFTHQMTRSQIQLGY